MKPVTTTEHAAPKIVQKLARKPPILATIKDFDSYFVDRLIGSLGYVEIVFVFDTYRDNSIKMLTRKK